jgi:hypothetical protein
MEAFIITIVLMAALLIGADHRQVDSDLGLAIEKAALKDHSVDCERSVHICDPGHNTLIQRDLTVPLDQQVNEDAK